MNPRLLEKYDVPAPRYTSYPTVPYWENSPSAEQWLAALQQQFSEGHGAALYVHIPFCEQLCTFCGCNTRITRNHGISRPYLERVVREFTMYRECLGIDKIPLKELHLGGGTPTFFNSEELKSLLLPILEHCATGDNFEFSIEVDPRVTTPVQLSTLHELSFRRISLGVQDFDPLVQSLINREQSFAQVSQLTNEARKIGFRSVNFDLIYGLPRQTLASMRETFEKVISIKPDRIAFYAYAHVPWIKPSHRKFTEDDLPKGAAKRALYELGRKCLEEAGYLEIGMDHFALPTDRLTQSMQGGTLHRNFMGYMTEHVSPLLGLGVSAIGDAWTAFAQNEKSVESYMARVDEGKIPLLRGHVLTNEDLIIRRHVLQIMTRFETSWEDASSHTPFLDAVPQRLQELMRDGLVVIDGQHLRVPAQGKPFIRNIGMAFDARLAAKAPHTELFSRSI